MYNRELRVGDLIRWWDLGGIGTVLRIYQNGDRKFHPAHFPGQGELIDYVTVLTNNRRDGSTGSEILTIPLDYLTDTAKRIG